jgi:hypothetical protein
MTTDERAAGTKLSTAVGLSADTKPSTTGELSAETELLASEGPADAELRVDAELRAAPASVWSRSGNAVMMPVLPRDARSDVEADATGDAEIGRPRVTRSITSGAPMAIAAFAFACAQAIGGLVAGPVSSAIPGAADSPSNHLRIIAVIYIGMGCAGAVLALLALRRAGDDVDAPRWATYLAGAAIVLSALVVLQALLLILLSTLAPN